MLREVFGCIEIPDKKQDIQFSMIEIRYKQPFGDRLSMALNKFQTPLCVGIDPHMLLMPDLFKSSNKKQQIEKLESFSLSCIEAAHNRVPAIKPQVALFEKFGPEGMGILQRIGKTAQSAGLLVIMDAKRGDIGSTSNAYAEGWLGEDAAFYCDALTVNPYLGLDTLKPFIEEAIKGNNGLFILLKTSNPGSSDLQELYCDDKPIYQHLADKLSPTINWYVGKTGWSSIGVVVGATNPKEAKLIRKFLPSSPFLIPGFGAQGANASMALCGLEYINEKIGYQGGLVNSSRDITFGKNMSHITNISEYVSSIIQNINKSKDKLKL